MSLLFFLPSLLSFLPLSPPPFSPPLPFFFLSSCLQFPSASLLSLSLSSHNCLNVALLLVISYSLRTPKFAISRAENTLSSGPTNVQRHSLNPYLNDGLHPSTFYLSPCFTISHSLYSSCIVYSFTQLLFLSLPRR